VTCQDELVARRRVAATDQGERDIAVLAADGLTSREIAARLDVSVRTVDNLLQRVYTKLGVNRRSELASRLGGREIGGG
jgi:DNA-binding CsgD family transcriptional regulator